MKDHSAKIAPGSGVTRMVGFSTWVSLAGAHLTKLNFFDALTTAMLQA